MDVFSDVIETLELRGTLYFRTQFSPPWGVRVPAYRDAARFHLVARGSCHVGLENGEWVALEPGDLILIPRGAPHVLADAPDTPALPLDDVLARSGFDGEGVLAFGGPENPCATVELICGHFSFGHGADHPLLRALPDHMRVSNDIRLRHLLLDETLRLVARVMFAAEPGATASVIRLSEVLFVEAVRACASQDTGLQRVLDALYDPRIGKALRLIHRHPDRPWTVASLGREVAMSRSRFAAEFQQRIGLGPMAYLADWRLQKARRLLKQRASIQRVAADVGYRSAAAFTRAFSQRFGEPPSALRRADDKEFA